MSRRKSSSRRAAEGLFRLAVAACFVGVCRFHWGKLVMPVGSSSDDATMIVASQQSLSAKVDEPSHTVEIDDTKHKNTPPSKRTTKIVTFADMAYKDVVMHWYERLSDLGYSTHTIVAMDRELLDSIQQINRNRTLASSVPAFRVEHVGGPDCPLREHFGNRAQAYRRRLFAARWQYVLQQLLNDTHVLLTDADNLFHRLLPLPDLEDSSFDLFHAFEGGVPSFPKNVFARWGFTVCGGMTWLRSVPAVVRLLRELAEERCRCAQPTCACRCDDQVVWNNLHLEHGVLWERHPANGDRDTNKGSGLEDGRTTGRCPTTGVRIAMWDRHTAYRGPIPGNRSLCPRQNWVSMPLTPPDATKRDLDRLWDQACGSL